MKSRTLQSIIFASVVALASSVSYVSAAETNTENKPSKMEKSATTSSMQEEMLVVLSDTQLFDIEAYKANMTNAILASAKQLLIDATRGQTYIAAN